MKRNCFRECPLTILGKLSVVMVWACAVAMPPVALAKLPPQWTTLTGMFDATLAEDHVVGGSVALVERGHMVARRDYGFADQANAVVCFSPGRGFVRQPLRRGCACLR